MRQFVGQVVKGRVAIHLIVHWVVKAAGIIGVGGMDVHAFHGPDADAFLTAGIHIAGHFNGHLRVGGVEAANMFVVETGLAANKDFPEGPFVIAHAEWNLCGSKSNTVRTILVDQFRLWLIGGKGAGREAEQKLKNSYLYKKIAMTRADTLRNEIISKLLTISDRSYLAAINRMIESKSDQDAVVKLSEEQKLMLHLSEEDIQYGRTIDEAELNKRDLLWLREL